MTQPDWHVTFQPKVLSGRLSSGTCTIDDEDFRAKLTLLITDFYELVIDHVR
jgi:hypothetical protein